MSASQLLFYIMSLIALGSALIVAASKNLIRSVFMFFVTLFALAGLYVLALADFMAVTQVVVYVGGILVLILFAFMLSGRESLIALQNADKKLWKISNVPALMVSGLFCIVLVNVFLKSDIDHLKWITQSIQSKNYVIISNEMTSNIGVNLMTRYLLPFEVISILLLMALIGAAHLSRKEEAIQ